MAEGYVARLPSSVVARIAPRGPTPGEAIGRGVAQLGEVLGNVAEQNTRVEEQIAQSNFRIGEQIKARERSAVSAMWAGKLADLKLETRKAVADMRAKSKEGAIGHEEAVTADVDKRFEQFMQGLQEAAGGDPDVIERFAPSVRAARDDVIGDEAAWALGKRAEAQGNGVEKALDGIRNEQLTKPDPQKLMRDLTGLKQIIESADWDGNAKATVWEKVLQGGFGATLDGSIANGQIAGARKILTDGSLDGIVSPEQKKGYLQRLDAAEREQQLEAERAASAEREAATDDLKLIKVLTEDGKEAVPQSRINAALERARKAGVKPDVLAEYAYVGEGAVQAARFRQMPTPQLSAEVATLTAKRNAGQISAEEERRLARAEKVMDDRDGEKGDSLGSLWKQGEAGQAQVMAQLAALPGDERVRVADKMGQGKLALVSGLRPQVQQTSLIGGRTRADRPDAFMPVGPKGGTDDSKKFVRAAFEKAISPALANALGGRYGDVLEAALDFYVGSQAQAGTAGAWDERAFAKAVNVIYGAYQGPDGRVRGGLGDVRGRKVELPPHWTAQEFDQRISVYDFAGQGAVYRDGRPAERGDVLANYQPVVERMDNGRVLYRLQDARGRSLTRKDGSLFLLPVNNDPRKKERKVAAPTVPGLIEAGNIDLHHRPVVKNKDGSISTVRSISVGTDRGEVLIPTVSPDGRILSEKDAVALYKRTGQHLGIFRSPREATAYAQSLHNEQAVEYGAR